MSDAVVIKTLVRQGASPGPRLLITGGVHGDEFEPMAAVRRLAQLVEPAKLRGRLTLAPCVNEAAFNNRHRCAPDSLDLARTCPGGPTGSVTVRTAHALTALIHDSDFYIDLHTGGTTLSVFPLAGYTLHAVPKVLEIQRAMARAFNLPFVWGATPNLDGRSLSVARDANIPAIYTEYLGPGPMSEQGVCALVDGCLNVMARLGMIDRSQPASLVRWIVEDERENSGYMQIQNTAPIDGFFEPAVELGQGVAIGDAIGSICDVTGSNRLPIVSRLAGMVVVVRTCPHVRKGEPLSVVVEIDRPLGGKTP